MAGINKVILVGNLGRDPEIRSLEGGAKVANFTLATSETFKDKNGNKAEHTEWHNIAVWRGLADVAEKYLKKGDRIYLEGRIRTRSWDDKDGNKRYSTDIIGDTFTMLSTRKAENGSPGKAEVSVPEETFTVNEQSSDDLPF